MPEEGSRGEEQKAKKCKLTGYRMKKKVGKKWKKIKGEKKRNGTKG